MNIGIFHFFPLEYTKYDQDIFQLLLGTSVVCNHL